MIGSLFATLWALVRLTHPFPSLLVAGTVLIVGRLAPGDPPLERVLRLSAAMLAAQFAIGTANDWFDLPHDRRAKPGKPLASGRIQPGQALVLLVALLLTATAIGASLGPASLALLSCGLALGLLYDAGLKRTVVAWVPYALALPLVPVWVWVSLHLPPERLIGALPLGLLLGLGLHLANALADLEADTALGVGGLAQRLGPRRAPIVCLATLGLGFGLATAQILAWHGSVAGIAAAAGALGLLAGAYVFARTTPSSRSWRAVFALAAIGTATLAIGWLIAVPGPR